MLMNQASLKIAKASSTDQTRYALCGLYIMPDGSTVATDGHIMVNYRPKNMPEAVDFPLVPGFEVNSEEQLTPFILPREDALNIAKMPGKPRRSLPILAHLALDTAQTNKNGNAYFASTDLATVKTAAPAKIDGQFPEWIQIMPNYSQEEAPAVGFTLSVFKKLLETMEAAGCTHFGMQVKDWQSPVEITANAEDGQVHAVIMPARL